MSVVSKLRSCRYFLLKLGKSPDCVKITGYDLDAIKYNVDGLDRAIKHYESEAKRVKKYYRPGGT